MENTFRITFSGEILPETDIHDARQKVAAFLEIDEALAGAYISGMQAFSMDGLDFVTARKYEKRFERAGAVCTVWPMHTCPVCGYRQTELRQCPWCEYRPDSPDAEDPGLPEHMSAVSDAETAPEVASPREMHKIKAVSGIKAGGLLLAGAFFSDPLFQTIFTLDFPWLCLLPLPFFVYGCMNLARFKGYPGALGLLGATLLPGLILLFLLRDRNAPQARGRFFSRERIAAFLLIPVFIFWAYQKTGLHLQKNQIEFMRGELERAALSTAPAYPLNYKLMALRAYLNHGFGFAEENELRLREKYWLAHALFEGADRFFIHMRYQQFVRYRAGEAPSDAYGAANIRRLRNEISEFFKRKVIELDDDYLIRCCVYWPYMEESYRAEIFSQKTREFIRRLNLIEKDLALTISTFANRRHHMPENAEDLSDFLRADPRLQKKAAAFKALRSAADVTFEPGGEITLTLRDDTAGLAGQTIVYGLMVRRDFSDVSPLKIHRLLRIGGTLPDKYRVDISWVRFFEKGISDSMNKTDFMAHVFEWLIRQLRIFH